MSVIVSQEETGPSKKRLTVQIPADDVAAETRKVVDDYGRSASVPGFRKGKVPASVVLKRYRENIEREVVERLIPRFWDQAEKEAELKPLASPQVEEVGDLAEGEALTFSATVEVRPEIALDQLDGFDLPEREVDPTEEEVDEALDDLRRRVADWIPVERSAARGDRVKATIREIGDGASGESEAGDGEAGESEAGDTEPAVDESATESEAAGAESAAADEAGEPPASAEESGEDEVVVEVGDPRVWEELSLALTGLSAGQQGRFTRRPEGEGDARTFELTVQAVEERDLPPLDDALAAKLGDFETADDLRKEVVEGLRSSKRAELRRDRQKSLFEQLRGRYPVQVPQGVLDHEVEHLLTDYAAELGRRGVDPSQSQVDWQSLSSQARPEAERRVHDKLILDAVAEHWEIGVEPSDLDAAIATIARARGESAAELRSNLQQSGRIGGLAAQIRRDKTVRRLLGEELEVADAAVADTVEPDTVDTDDDTAADDGR